MNETPDAPRRPLRIVFGVTSHSWGGNEKWAVTAAAGLARRGHHVTVLWSRSAVLEKLRERGLPRRRAFLVSNWNPVGIGSLALYFLAARPDVVVLTRRREYMAGGLAARAAGLARSQASRPLVALRLGLKRRLGDAFANRTAFGRVADLVIVNSEPIRDTLVESEWLDPAKIRVLLNGVETSPPAAGRGGETLRSLGVPSDAPVIVAAGQLSRRKGFDVLIDAVASVRKELPATTLVILGAGGGRAELEGRAEAAGIRDGVVFAGHRDDVRDIMAASDVYVLSSRNEGMANTLLEAMSVGAPIVATDVPGTVEAVTHGSEALIVPPDDRDATAAAVLRLLRERDLAASLGSAALARARERFGVDRMVGELESMFFETLPRIRTERGAGLDTDRTGTSG